MSSPISEEKENPIVTLRAQAEKFDFSKLRADEKDISANSGKQMYEDFDRMNFVINKKNIDTILIKALINRDKEEFDKFWEKYCEGLKVSNDKETDRYKEEVEKFYNIGKGYTNLLPKEEDENKSYRAFAKEVFKEIFKYAEAQVPSDSILEELVINCNQAGYVGALYAEDKPLFHVAMAYELVFGFSHTTHINCSDPSHATIRIEEKIAVCTLAKSEEELCKLDSSLEFTLKSQGDKNVTYEDGKLSLTVPKRLKDYNIGDKNLFDVIKECFQKFCERLGFFKIKIEHGLGDPLEVSDHLENMEPPIRSNEHGLN